MRDIGRLRSAAVDDKDVNREIRTSPVARRNWIRNTGTTMRNSTK